MHSTESPQRYAGSHDSARCSIAHIREYFREFETEFENILGCYSGA
jgi:hypothetical protein